MTLHRIEQAVVMDTDDIPGRGGYAVVGMSDGVSQSERLFVAQNFGISDYLHDPQNQRVFYSFFRVPNGRRALVRRFAKGHRRNQTQNRLFVHTLFVSDELFDALEGVPWLLIQANVRAAGTDDWDVLKDDLPGLVVDAPLPALEANVAADGLAQRFTKRLDALTAKLDVPPRDAVAALVTSLAHHGRVALPQGSAWETLTMLAWSMLPRPDREELAWTQHDTQNISGVAFALANVAEGASPQFGSIDPFAKRIVEMNTLSDTSRRELDERTAKYGLTIRRSEEIDSWLAWRDALGNVKENIRAGEDEVLAYLKKLERTARRRQQNDPWIDGEEVLQMLWNNIPAAIAAGENPMHAVERWARLLRESGLHAILFQQPPDARWLARAASEVGADLLVRFFIFGTDAEPAAAPVRERIAEWVSGTRPIHADTLARLALRLAADRSPHRTAILERLLSSDAGLEAARELTPRRAEFGTFAFDAAEIAIREQHAHAAAFVADVLIPLLELSPRLAARITPPFATDVASLLRENGSAYVRFAARLQPDVATMLNETITGWMTSDPRRTAGLARAILPHVFATAGAAEAAPLALALARAGEPAHVWFGVLLERAAAIDSGGERRAALDFGDAVSLLRSKTLRLDGALELLVRLLESAAASRLRVGDSVRALMMLLRPAWSEDPRALIAATGALVQQTKLASGWEPVVEAIVADFGRTQKLRKAVSQLVADYWRTVDPLQVPDLDERLVESISILDDAARRQLAAEWQTRLRRLPESDTSQLLLSQLYPERGASARELRIAFAQREIDQRIATLETLNRLESALHAARGDAAGEDMCHAILRYVRQSDPVARVLAYLELLDAPALAQTVKHIIETMLLPRALHDLKPARWTELSAAADVTRVFNRGIATMLWGYELGRTAPEHEQRHFESACRAKRRIDGLHALAEGRRRRGTWGWARRMMRIDDGFVSM